MATLHDLISVPDTIANDFLASTYPAIAKAVSMPVTYVAILYWAVLGIQMYRGYASSLPGDLLAKFIMTSLVFATLNWSGFAQSIYSVFKGVCDGSALAILGGQSADSLLDGLITKVKGVSDILMGLEIWKIGMILQGLLLFLVNCLLFVVALALMTVSKIGLAVTMVLLPLFVGFFFFSATRQWGMNWISKMLNFTFIYVLVCAIVRFGFSAFGSLVEATNKAAGVTDAVLLSSTYLVNILVLECRVLGNVPEIVEG